MPVLSNNGRLISSLPITSTIGGQDELLLQSSGITKRINYATLSGSIINSQVVSIIRILNHLISIPLMLEIHYLYLMVLLEI
jgi:hypothetical protein